VTVHVYADGAFLAQVLADVPRPDLAAGFRLHGGDHGFEAQLVLSRRPATVCAYAIDVRRPGGGPPETNPLLGCAPG
jgi:hypothetical protein